MNKLIILMMFLMLSSVALAYNKGDAAFNVDYDIAEPLVLANGTIIQYTPNCFNECWLPINLEYSGSLTTSTKTLRSSDISFKFLDVESKLSRTMIIQYFYAAYEYATASTWVPEKDCIENLPDGVIIKHCDKGSWKNETKTGWFLHPLTEITMQKETPKIIFIKGTGSSILGSAVDIVPTIFGMEMKELAMWNATWSLGSPSAHTTKMGIQVNTSADFVSGHGIDKMGYYSGMAVIKCEIWNQTGSITIIGNTTNISNPFCYFNPPVDLQPSEWYFITLSVSSGNRYISGSLSYPIDTGFNLSVMGGIFYDSSWHNDAKPTGVSQVFDFYNISIVETGGSLPTTTELYIDGTRSNQTFGFNPSRVINLTGVIDQNVWIAIDINGSMVANDTSENGIIKYNFTGMSGGLYNITAYFDGDDDWDASSETFWITIQPNPTNIMLYINGTSGYWNSSYPNSTLNLTAIANETIPISILRNGTIICNGTSTCYNITLYGSGWYNFTANFSGNENYSASSKTWFANISKGSQPLAVSSNATWNISYPVVAQITGSGNLTTASLYRNGSLVSNPYSLKLGVGGYNFIYNTSGNANYSANSTANTLTINKGTTILNITFNESSPAIIGVVINVSCSANNDNEGIGWQLYNDTDNIASAFNYTYVWDTAGLSAGTYNFTCNQTATANYTGGIGNSSFILAEAGSFVIDQVLDERSLTPLTFNISIYNSTFSTTSYDISTYNNNSVKGNLTLAISASGYVERNYYVDVGENDTLNMTGYLLQSDEGVYIDFWEYSANNPLGEPSALNNFSRFIGSSWVLIEQQLSDFEGKGIIFLDPYAEYRINASKGSLNASQDSYSPNPDFILRINLGGSLGGSNITWMFSGINYSLTPTDSYLGRLSNLTTICYNISSDDSNIDWFALNLSYWNGSSLYYYNESTEPYGSSICVSINSTNLNGTLTATTWLKVDDYDAASWERRYFVWYRSSIIPDVMEDIQALGLSDLTEMLIAFFVCLGIGLALSQSGYDVGSGIGFLIPLFIFVLFGWFGWELYLGLCLIEIGVLMMKGLRGW